MSAEAGDRWRRIDTIVEAALEIAEDERPAYLARACGEDAELRREVESLLAHDRSDGFLEVPAAAEAARLAGATEPSSLVGKRIGRFEILERIGRGGMGEVYLAHDARLRRRVAIKRLPAHLSADASRVRRFRQEALAASALNHPNIVTVHEIVEDEGGDLLVTELVDGVTLRERTHTDGALPLPAVAHIGLQIARGLAAAHAIGIIHRDVKPENVMIRRDGLVKLLDFGIAKSTQRMLETEGTGTSPGALVGTVGYMSPEQARGLPVDSRTDVWSVGVILYELATGVTPFAGATPSDRLAAILERDPVPPSQHRCELPADFDRLVAKALAKDAAARHADAEELAAAIATLESGEIAEGESATETYAPLTPRPSRRPFLRYAAPALATVLGLGLAAWGAWHYASRDSVDSLAVLPFENRSNVPDDEYLGDGLAESLIDQMSRLPSLRVMARATVFRFKGTSDPLEAGRRLGVGAVLTGTVSRRGDRLLIWAELIQTATGLRLWGESYDRGVADLLHVQDSIAADIAERLRPRLSPEERLSLRSHGTDDPLAYDLFLKARFWFDKDTEGADFEARRLFQLAVEKDPRFIEPRIGIAVIHSRAAVNGYARPSDSWPRVEEEVVKALAVDPANLLARAQRVNRVFLFEWDFSRVEREYREMARDPRLALGRRFSPILPTCLFLWARGFTEEAAALLERALAGDRGNTEVRVMRADLLALAGHLEPAIALYQGIVDSEPDDPRAWFGLAEVRRRGGDIPGAIDALRKAYELSEEPAGTEALSAARTEADYEKAQIAVARSRLADLLALSRERYVSPLNLARLRAQVGDREDAFATLEAAFAERSPGLVFLKVDRAWDRIRDDPRFPALVRRVGIP